MVQAAYDTLVQKETMPCMKYYLCIKVHTQEAQNPHQLKSPLSDLTS
jgi:hypothetical protein